MRRDKAAVTKSDREIDFEKIWADLNEDPPGPPQGAQRRDDEKQSEDRKKAS